MALADADKPQADQMDGATAAHGGLFASSNESEIKKAVKANKIEAFPSITITTVEELGFELTNRSAYTSRSDVAKWLEASGGKMSKEAFADLFKKELESLRKERLSMIEEDLRKHAFDGACTEGENLLKTKEDMGDAYRRAGIWVSDEWIRRQEASFAGTMDQAAFLSALTEEDEDFSNFQRLQRLKLAQAFDAAGGNSNDPASRLKSVEQFRIAAQKMGWPPSADFDKTWNIWSNGGIGMTIEEFKLVVKMEPVPQQNSTCCTTQ